MSTTQKQQGSLLIETAISIALIGAIAIPSIKVLNTLSNRYLSMVHKYHASLLSQSNLETMINIFDHQIRNHPFDQIKTNTGTIKTDVLDAAQINTYEAPTDHNFTHYFPSNTYITDTILTKNAAGNTALVEDRVGHEFQYTTKIIIQPVCRKAKCEDVPNCTFVDSTDNSISPAYSPACTGYEPEPDAVEIISLIEWTEPHGPQQLELRTFYTSLPNPNEL